MPRAIYRGGAPLLSVQERPAGPTSGNGLVINAAAGTSQLSAREVEDLRDSLADWLSINGR